ncbi:MAG TPA: TetR/AcrR family transcriptional regulator [Dyella sp.]|uniref:TetR/AcrR family transcriptional regulator n=1 Tax=Dyella sp. TaxID=1869338 RepID=UPI002F930F78
MGHSRADKAQTHERLVEAAAKRFRERGLDGISLADLMKELGLTHGGFYKHFASRDALVAEAMEHAFEESERAGAKLADADGHIDLARYADFYLSEAHRDSPGNGCAVSALSADISRRDDATRARYRERMDETFARIGAAFPGDAKAQRRQAIEYMTRMYGALLIARGAGDSDLSREVLDTVREQLQSSLPTPG